MAVETFKIVQTGSPIRRHDKQRRTSIGLAWPERIGRVAEGPNTAICSISQLTLHQEKYIQKSVEIRPYRE